MAMTMAAARLPLSAHQPQDYVPDQSRTLHGATRWYATPVCAMLNHRWESTPWSRWACGWDRESTCLRCGQSRHERARLQSDFGEDRND